MNEHEKAAAAREAFIKEDAARRTDNAAAAREEEERNRPPAVCLGTEGREHVLYSTLHRRIYRMTADRIKIPNLREIAPLEHWKRWLFPERVAAGDVISRGELLDSAQERIFLESGSKFFNAEKVRARGIWRDGDSWIYNAGDKCFSVVCGNVTPVDNVTCLHVYAVGADLPAPAADMLTDAEGELILQLIQARTWQNVGNGELVAGWLVASMLAGAVPISPHIWINAPAGTGKTYLKNDIAHILQSFAVVQEGVPTSASLWQRLNGAALPVILDEVESGGSRTNRRNVKRLLDLMRSAFCGTAPIAKGGADGIPRLYPVKCSMLLFSINNDIERDSDSSRCLMLSMKKETKERAREIWRGGDEGRELLQTPDFLGRLISRLLRGLPVLMENIAALTKHLRALDGVDSRRGELFAVLMACRYALTSSSPLTDEQAQHAADILQEYAAEEVHESDSCRCLSHLLGHVLRVSGGHGEMNVQSICQEIHRRKAENSTDCKDLEQALKNVGLVWRDDKKALCVDARAARMAKIYAGTQWSNGKITGAIADGARRGDGKSGANAAGIWFENARIGGLTPVMCLFIPAALIL